MIRFKRLSNETLNKYNFYETKKNVDKFMEPLYELIFQFRNISPPSISQKLNDVSVQCSKNTTSIVEKYVIKKIEKEEQVIEYYKCIQSIIDLLRDDEKLCFKAEYFEELSREKLAEKLNCSIPTVVQIKKSAIIKFALALDLAVMKGD